MPEKMSKQEAKDFVRRWQMVNDFEVEELQRTPPEVRLRQFFTLMAWAREFGWEKDEKAVAEVRQRWMKLRQVRSGETYP